MDLISFKPAYYFSIQIKEIIQIFAQTDLFGNRKINRAFKLENKWARNIGVNRSAPREPANRVTRLCTIHGILSDLASQIRPPSGPSPRLQEILQEILKGFVTASLRKRKLVFEKKLILNPSPEIKKSSNYTENTSIEQEILPRYFVYPPIKGPSSRSSYKILILRPLLYLYLASVSSSGEVLVGGNTDLGRASIFARHRKNHPPRNFPSSFDQKKIREYILYFYFTVTFLLFAKLLENNWVRRC